MEKDFNRIKEWALPKIKARGMTVQAFATRVGISRAMIYYYFNDDSRPSVEVMARICETLGVSLDEGLRQYTERPNGRPRDPKSTRKRILTRPADDRAKRIERLKKAMAQRLENTN